MNITFWVTERCNLACKYCYVHKQPKTMTLETAEQTIKYFTNKFDETVAAGKRINVALHGGEPLLNFDVIRYIVETLKERYDGHIIFTMTTNGTVFEKDIYDFIKGKVQISVSIDGNRKTNDTKIGYVDSDGNKVFLPGESEEKYQNMKNDYGKRMRFNFVTITPEDILAFPGSQVGDIYTDIQTPEIDYASITKYEDMLIAGVPALYRITNGKITEFYFDSVEIEEFFNSMGR